MTGTIHVTYLFDPLCGWCYGASAAYAWANDQRIARLSGQIFSEDYRREVLGNRTWLLDSGPATLSLAAVHLIDPARELDALKAIQEARYIRGRDVTGLQVLTDVLGHIGLTGVAERLLAPDKDLLTANRTRVAAARADMEKFGADGVPALIVGPVQRRRLLRASALFGGIDVLVAGLKAA